MSTVMDDESSRWKTFGERMIYDSPWVWLGQVDVELPGGERFWHHIVRLHRAAVIVLLDDEDRVLLLWRHRFLPDRWGWEIPGGLVDEGEEPAGAAGRELEEETGYRAGRIEHLITFQPMVGSVDSEHHVFVGREPERIGEPTDTSELARLEWVPLKSVPEMIASGDIWNAGSLVALMRVLMTDVRLAGRPVSNVGLQPREFFVTKWLGPVLRNPAQQRHRAPTETFTSK